MTTARLKMPAINRANLAAMRQWSVNDDRIRLIRDAYLRMATAYRPGAPSDGFGQVLLDDNERTDPVRLEMEAWFEAARWYDDDERMEFTVHGCPDYRNIVAMWLALQAAQVCCGGSHFRIIRRLLELAIEALPPEED